MHLQNHTKQINTLQSGLKTLLIGLSDGIIISFAVITGLQIMATNNNPILEVGGIVVAVGAIFFGLGGYFAGKDSEANFSKKSKEDEEIYKQQELEKTISLFSVLGLGKDLQAQASVEIENENAEWKAYLEEHAQEPERKGISNPYKTGGFITLAFAVGGLIPLLPFFYIPQIKEAFLLSAACSTMALLLVGILKSKLNKQKIFLGTIRLLLLGIFASVAAYAVAYIFK